MCLFWHTFTTNSALDNTVKPSIMRNVNRYVIYNEGNRVNGNVAAEFTSLAYDEEHVREMADEQGIDLEGYTIECTKNDVRDELRRPYAPCFRIEF